MLWSKLVIWNSDACRWLPEQICKQKPSEPGFLIRIILFRIIVRLYCPCSGCVARHHKHTWHRRTGVVRFVAFLQVHPLAHPYAYHRLPSSSSRLFKTPRTRESRPRLVNMQREGGTRIMCCRRRRSICSSRFRVWVPRQIEDTELDGRSMSVGYGLFENY